MSTNVIEELESNAKTRGAYSTPMALAQFLVNWAIRSQNDFAIDISCGDGVFLEAIAHQLVFLGGDISAINRITGIEIDPATAKQAHDRVFNSFGLAPKIIPEGFFETLPSLSKGSYDAVVGNPPFVRYRHYIKRERDLGLQFLQEQGFRATKMTNAWVPFLIATIYLLKPKGRMAIVMPAELFQVSYANEIREYLLNDFGFVFVVAFSNLVFPDVEQEIVLLMGTKEEGEGLRLIEVKDESELVNIPQSRVPQIPVENSKEKWTQYFLNDEQRRVLRESINNPAIMRLGELCSVDVGVVTGRNEFFVISKDFALELEAEEHLSRIVTRTKNFQGLIFTKDDWKQNLSNNIPSYLLDINLDLELSESLLHHIDQGEQKGWQTGFKCRNREPWYKVPSVWVPDAFLFRQVGSFPKLVLNSAEATCTDTLHRVKFKEGVNKENVSSCFHNSLTFAFAEIFGRSYGGGVLELMPTEAEKLPLPIHSSTSKLLSEIDGLIRDGLSEDAINLCDERILIEQLGFDKKDVAVIRSSWHDLLRRRKSRKRR